MDFVHDQLATGGKLRVLTIIDIFSRFSPALEPRFTFRGTDVVATLDRVCNEVGGARSGHHHEARATSERTMTLATTSTHPAEAANDVDCQSR